MAAEERGLSNPETVLTRGCGRLRAGLRACERRLAAEIAARLKLADEASALATEIRRVKSELEMLGDADPPPSEPLPKLEKRLARLEGRIARHGRRETRLRERMRGSLERTQPLLSEAGRLGKVWRHACEATAMELLARETERIVDAMRDPDALAEDAEGRLGAAFDDKHASVRAGEANPVWLETLRRGGAGKDPTPEEGAYAGFLLALRAWNEQVAALEEEMTHLAG